MDNLEAVGSLLLERTKADFVLYKAFFAVGCGQSGEKNNAIQGKIWQEQPDQTVRRKGKFPTAS